MGSIWNMLAYLDPRLWQHMQGHSTAAEVTGSSKTIITPRIQLRPSQPTIPFKMCRRRFAIIITFATKISKAQRQMLKSDGKHLPSPVLLQILISQRWYCNIDGYGHRTENCKFRTSNIVYREVLRSLRILNTQYLGRNNGYPEVLHRRQSPPPSHSNSR